MNLGPRNSSLSMECGEIPLIKKIIFGYAQKLLQHQDVSMRAEEDSSGIFSGKYKLEGTCFKTVSINV